MSFKSINKDNLLIQKDKVDDSRGQQNIITQQTIQNLEMMTTKEPFLILQRKKMFQKHSPFFLGTMSTSILAPLSRIISKS
jgi:hypothetical protein